MVSSVCTKTHAFSAVGSDATINSVAGRQAKQLFTGRQKIQSIKVSNNQTTAMTIDFYDGAGASAFNGKLIHRVHVGAVRENLDFDMHGSVVNDGLYVLVSGAGTKVNVSVSAQYN
tara:strand:+ start:421 stop:768 length:348 start_codon:yes stop_codon:yes gene_type:complete